MERLKAEVEQYIGELRTSINGDINALQDYVNARVEQIEKQAAKAMPKQEGIVIDHKTFSEIVNTLMVCGSQGVISNDLAFRLIEIGKAQTGEVVEQGSEPTQEPAQDNVQEPKQKEKCNGNCQECKEPHAEKIRKAIANDPIMQLLSIVREAAAHKK